MKNNKLHIAILDLDHIRNPLLSGGQATATYEVGKRLAAKGHEVIVYCSKYPNYKDGKIQGIYYKHIGINTGNIRLNNVLYFLTIPFALQTIKADVILECFTAPISTLFSPLFTRTPVVALTTSFNADHFSKKYHLPFDKIERFGLRFYKYALPLSGYNDARLKSMNKNILTKIVPEGVDESFFSIKWEKPEHILFLGRFDMNQKGIDLLLHAYAEQKEHIPYPLVIAGVGPDEEKIVALIKKLQLGDRVRLIGPTYGKKKMRVLGKSLFIALPSRHETFSVFALEALAAGRSLVAFDIPGLSWIDRKVLYKTHGFTIESYANLLVKMSKKQTAKKLGKQARIFARQFSWDTVTEKYIAFFSEVLLWEANKVPDKKLLRVVETKV